jgi:hypothetical protein
VRYCSKECQVNVHKEHKKKCTHWLLKEVEKREEKHASLIRQHDACVGELTSKRGTGRRTPEADATEKRLADLIPELAEASEALAKDHIQTGALILQNVKTQKVNGSDEWEAYDKAWDLLQLAHQHAEEFE